MNTTSDKFFFASLELALVGQQLEAFRLHPAVPLTQTTDHPSGYLNVN